MFKVALSIYLFVWLSIFAFESKLALLAQQLECTALERIGLLKIPSFSISEHKILDRFEKNVESLKSETIYSKKNLTKRYLSELSVLDFSKFYMQEIFQSFSISTMLKSKNFAENFKIFERLEIFSKGEEKVYIAQLNDETDKILDPAAQKSDFWNKIILNEVEVYKFDSYSEFEKLDETLQNVYETASANFEEPVAQCESLPSSDFDLPARLEEFSVKWEEMMMREELEEELEDKKLEMILSLTRGPISSVMLLISEPKSVSPHEGPEIDFKNPEQMLAIIRGLHCYSVVKDESDEVKKFELESPERKRVCGNYEQLSQAVHEIFTLRAQDISSCDFKPSKLEFYENFDRSLYNDDFGVLTSDRIDSAFKAETDKNFSVDLEPVISNLKEIYSRGGSPEPVKRTALQPFNTNNNVRTISEKSEFRSRSLGEKKLLHNLEN